LADNPSPRAISRNVGEGAELVQRFAVEERREDDDGAGEEGHWSKIRRDLGQAGALQKHAAHDAHGVSRRKDFAERFSS
jgi:hypothetical protein